MSGNLSSSYTKVNQEIESKDKFNDNPQIKSAVENYIKTEIEMTTGDTVIVDDNKYESTHNEDILIAKDSQKQQQQQQQNKQYQVVAKLGEDTWALGYIIGKTKNKLPYSYICLLIFIYFVQSITLFAMVYGFYFSTVYDVVKEMYWGTTRCINADPATLKDTNWNKEIWNLNYTKLPPITCFNGQFIEYSPEYQRFYDNTIGRNANRFGLGDIEAIQSTPVWVFLLCQITSFCVLMIYTISSMVNPVIMLTIGYNEVNYKCIIYIYIYIYTYGYCVDVQYIIYNINRMVLDVVRN